MWGLVVILFFFFFFAGLMASKALQILALRQEMSFIMRQIKKKKQNPQTLKIHCMLCRLVLT